MGFILINFRINVIEDGYGQEHGYLMVETGRSNLPYLQKHNCSSMEKNSRHSFHCMGTNAGHHGLTIYPPAIFFHEVTLSQKCIRISPVISPNSNKKSEE